MGDGQGSLACCSPWGGKESDTGPDTQLASPTSVLNIIIIIGLPGHTTVYCDPHTPQFYLSVSLPTLSFQHPPSHSDPQFSSVAQLCLTLCHPMDCSMPGFPAHHQLLSLLKLMSIESVLPSNHLILCHPLLLLPSIFPSIRVFCSESVLRIRWPKDWNFSFSISPPSEYSGLTSFRMDWCAPQAPMLQYTLGRHHHFPKGFLYFLALPPWVLHFAALSNPGHLFCAPGTTESRD